MNYNKTIFIHKTAIIAGDVAIGNYSSIWPFAVLRGDFNKITIGEYTNIQDNAVIHPTPFNPVEIGNYVTAAHSCILHGCKIEDNVLVGMGAIILDGARVGKDSIVAAGALVKENAIIPENSLVVGIPAQIKENRGNGLMNKQNAFSYYELSRTYISGEEKISPEDLMNAMQRYASK